MHAPTCLTWQVPDERTTVVDGPALVSKFLGESEANMRALFADAIADQQKARSGKGKSGSSEAAEALDRLHVIIFDELDAICRARGHTDQAAGIVYDSLVNQLLSIMDGVAPLDNVHTHSRGLETLVSFPPPPPLKDHPPKDLTAPFSCPSRFPFCGRCS